MAHCRVLLCNINKKSGCQDGGFLSISNKDLVTFHFSLAIYRPLPLRNDPSFIIEKRVSKITLRSFSVCHYLIVSLNVTEMLFLNLNFLP